MSRPDPKRPRSIGPRLTLASAALVGACLALILGLVYWSTVSAARRELDERLHEEVAELEQHLSAGGHQALAVEIERRVRVVSGDGTVYLLLAESQRRLAGNLEDWPAWPAASQGTHWFTLPALRDGSGERRLRVEVLELPEGGRLLVGRSSDEHERLRGHLRLAVLIGFGSALVLAIGVGLGLSHGLLQRVQGMTETVRCIRAGERSRRVRVGPRRDEFDQLAQSFNDLLDENEDLVGQVRGIADDVAHDLRTPLTRLRSRVEATLAAPRQSPEYVDALEDIRQDVDAVLETFQALLAITQLQNTPLGERMVALDLGSIVRDAVELYEPAAEEAGSALEVVVEGNVEVRGEPQLLTQALTNLIDNAIKYAAATGPIRVFARGAESHVELGVADRGPGIPPDQRERALRRFVRLDASRHLPGTGLGLSFVAAVARAHGAELALDDGEPGLVVTLRLPH